MKTLKFKCTLLSDVILNQKAATEGPNKTLDFIPGSCFLGIVASQYEKFEGEGTAMEIFHSGKVRFGDAHPSKGNVRGLKIPASMFHPKLEKASEELYIHHAVPNLDSDKMKKKQLKQCRNGFYTFVDNEAKEIITETNFAIKSAYDRKYRRSKDEQMYGYESLQKELELYFEVEVENDDLAKKIKDALVGNDKRVGRSRTAQYGLVKIVEYNYSEVKSASSENGLVSVYADGRLIFLDEYGLPTFQPTAEQLGLPKEASIKWAKSQIRTFQYSPWNYHRQCFDTDRCGIEKGSVFIVDVSGCGDLDLQSKYIGSYNNEGFGKVIYNPEFLKAKENGLASVKIHYDEKKDNDNSDCNEIVKKRKEIEQLQQRSEVVCRYLAICKKEELELLTIYKMVNDFVNDKKRGGLFTCKGEKFASQWGQIRSLAMREKNYDRLSLKLFGVGVDENGQKLDDKMRGYLTHGVAKEKWEDNRIEIVRTFYESVKKENLTKRISEAMVNLAAEMQKEMSRKEDK